jgi:FKBP-type peptidyl-prolyl cis-trans isomerase SlyD
MARPLCKTGSVGQTANEVAGFLPVPTFADSVGALRPRATQTRRGDPARGPICAFAAMHGDPTPIRPIAPPDAADGLQGAALPAEGALCTVRDVADHAIATDKVVSIHYTLTNAEKDVLDSSAPGEPLVYLHGRGAIVPGLERELSGKVVGDKLDVVVSPADGYGERAGPGPQPIPLEAFEGVDVQPGMPFMVEDDEGHHVPLWVVDVTEEHVMVDGNHPLAGETLHFAVEIVAVRDATDEELAHGHAHDGHHHHH